MTWLCPHWAAAVSMVLVPPQGSLDSPFIQLPHWPGVQGISNDTIVRRLPLSVQMAAMFSAPSWLQFYIRSDAKESRDHQSRQVKTMRHGINYAESSSLKIYLLTNICFKAFNKQSHEQFYNWLVCFSESKVKSSLHIYIRKKKKTKYEGILIV